MATNSTSSDHETGDHAEIVRESGTARTVRRVPEIVRRSMAGIRQRTSNAWRAGRQEAARIANEQPADRFVELSGRLELLAEHMELESSVDAPLVERSSTQDAEKNAHASALEMFRRFNDAVNAFLQDRTAAKYAALENALITDLLPTYRRYLTPPTGTEDDPVHRPHAARVDVRGDLTIRLEYVRSVLKELVKIGAFLPRPSAMQASSSSTKVAATRQRSMQHALHAVEEMLGPRFLDSMNRHERAGAWLRDSRIGRFVRGNAEFITNHARHDLLRRAIFAAIIAVPTYGSLKIADQFSSDTQTPPASTTAPAAPASATVPTPAPLSSTAPMTDEQVTNGFELPATK